MKSKAVIWNEDGTNNVVVLKRKQIEGRTFRYDNTLYLLDPEAPQITWIDRPGKWLPLHRSYFSTFYFWRGVSNPLNIREQAKYILKHRKEAAELRPNEMELKGKKGAHLVTYRNFVDLGVPAEELAAIFNPWFYRQIAAKARDTWEQIQFYASIAAVLGVIYLIYMLSTGHYIWPGDPIPPHPAPVPAPAPTG